jgi:hypothetical protein
VVLRRIIQGFQVLTAAGMKIFIFWVVAQCNLVEVYRRFRITCCARLVREFFHFKEPEGLFPSSNDPIVCPYPEPDKSNPHCRMVFHYDPL